MVRELIYSLIFLMLLGCVGKQYEIARLQSQVVELSIQCEEGRQTACDEKDVRLEKLKGLLKK